MICPFCNSTELKSKFANAPNKRDAKFGSFSVYLCKGCHSATTNPLPSPSHLKKFYDASAFGIDHKLRELRKDDPQLAWYGKIINQIKSQTNFDRTTSFTWLELGPGHGELAKLMTKHFPASHGVCVDFHQRPDEFESLRNVNWIQADLNESLPFKTEFDLVISVSVLEHVLDVRNFMNSIASHCKPGGHFYLIAPDQNSLLAKLMGRRWPYFLPGEHLHIPSIQGVHKLIANLGVETASESISVKSICIPYSIKYILSFFGIPGYQLIPINWSFPIPAGALEIRGQHG